ncbi:SGNH/GDSL hydrolase family protein [Cupriavidus sp.]|uniref:SGNH/GDSL hydrolase family protein n=1 Tax=Cupriavidus sp. TaxID=1873897 RepID=UPI0025C6B29D|nr:SGNH/GDSL hydrolase family protein [Cupriavidus sp.]MCA3186851.1 SGNH/GDSL hydrolase family protein [Cupriavidus sp.]MCA3192282.1 SGNH/GDSL hydrolase family protein [Cupriavidus sp.]MCA3196057.1 SGNH/GDSL hydrolase family protein [Cupriavidus sp.]MCA3203590.1 SGNH/GDSL hydrolase family protein [Cupriavidus sp.]MCA3206996.1 SGNH/GDSL hydrolase family protein [Cupriavidus sp.]
MNARLASISMALLVTLAGCGGGDGDSTQQASTGGGGTGAQPASPPPVTTPTPTPEKPQTALQATQALLKATASRGAIPGVMASPPIITCGTANMPSTIANSTLIAPDNPALRYNGTLVQAGPLHPDNTLVRNIAVNYGGLGRGSNVLHIDFVTDAPVFEILVKGNVEISAHRILVDGAYAATTPVSYPDDGNLYLTRVDFQGERKARHIRIETNDMRFGGIRVGQGDTVSAAPAQGNVRAIALGDSVTEGMSGHGYSFENYATRLGYEMGWKDMYVSGVGSTGYLAAPSTKLKLRDRLATDVYPFNPHVILIAAGINDAPFPPDALQAEAALLFDDIKAKLPNTIVFVLGPWSPGSTHVIQRDAIKAAVGGRANFHFIDNVGEQWQTGSGNVANPKGDGNGDVYVSADGTHPTLAGHIFLTEKVAAAMRKVIGTF